MTRLGHFVWLNIAIQHLLCCDGLQPAQVNGAYWKLSSTGGSVGLSDVTPCSARWLNLFVKVNERPDPIILKAKLSTLNDTVYLKL